MGLKLLLVDDEGAVLRALSRGLVSQDAEVVEAQQARDALELLDDTFHAVITDQYLPPGPSGIWLLENVMHERPDLPRILFSGQRVPHAEELVQIGLVHRFLRKPVRAHDVLRAVEEARRARRVSSNA